MSGVKVTPVASFPPNSFLENITVRHDGSILITVANRYQLYYLPKPGSGAVTPQLLHTFEQSPTGFVELEHDVFYISTTTFKDGPNNLWRLSMHNFTPTAVPKPVHVLTLPNESKLLNGSCVLSPSAILCADSWADLIWRIDIPKNGRTPSARVWLKHSMLAHSQDPDKFDVPGANGIKFNHKNGNIYFTTTAQTIFGHVPVDPETLDPVGNPEDVTERWMWGDDLVLDEEAGFAYVTTHRQNTIDRIILETGVRENVVEEPLNLDVIGPTAGSWSRERGDTGRVAYFLTDGVTKNPLMMLQGSQRYFVEFPPITAL